MNKEEPAISGENRNPHGTFKEGVSGNPNGRPEGAGISITTEIKKKLMEVPKDKKSTYLQLLINRIFKKAIQDGDSLMIKKIWEYIDGMPKQNLKLTGEIKTALVRFIGDDDGEDDDGSDS